MWTEGPARKLWPGKEQVMSTQTIERVGPALAARLAGHAATGTWGRRIRLTLAGERADTHGERA